jgi:hypothetical protein
MVLPKNAELQHRKLFPEDGAASLRDPHLHPLGLLSRPRVLHVAGQTPGPVRALLEHLRQDPVPIPVLQCLTLRRRPQEGLVGGKQT